MRQGPTPPTAGPSVAAGPSATAAGANPSMPAVCLPDAGDAEGSSSWPLPRGDIILGLGPLHLRLGIPGQPGGPHQSRGSGLPAQGSHLLRDPRRHPLHLIRVLLEPQIYLRHPSSGGLTSPATPSRGMLAAGREISMGRCTTISRHLPWTRGSETPCSSYNDTIWSHSWCRVSTIILGSSLSSIIR